MRGGPRPVIILAPGPSPRPREERMAMKSDDRCPCGSGRARAACCGEDAPFRINMKLIVIYLLIMGAGGAIAAIELMAPATTDTLVRVPDPWEYDSVNNRHWHAGHGHWHSGPPPGSGGDPTVTQFAPVSSPTGEPTASTPLPWYYDEANDRHWHAPHGHWHPGPPPADANSPNAPTSQPAG